MEELSFMRKQSLSGRDFIHVGAGGTALTAAFSFFAV